MHLIHPPHKHARVLYEIINIELRNACIFCSVVANANSRVTIDDVAVQHRLAEERARLWSLLCPS